VGLALFFAFAQNAHRKKQKAIALLDFRKTFDLRKPLKLLNKKHPPNNRHYRMARTAQQKIAELEAKLARAKKQERAQRARKLIEIGAVFLKATARLDEIPAEQRKNALTLLAKQTDDFAQKLIATYKNVGSP
jgi:proline dehydrogenase